jgi:hypothetical protein
LVHTIHVLDELGKGIEAEIRVVDPSDREEHFTYTDKRGASRPNKKCNSNQRLLPRPTIGIYRRLTTLPYCVAEVRIVLQRAGVAETLALKGANAADNRDFVLASMLYAESAFRIADVNPELAESLREKSLYSFQHGFPEINVIAFDPKQEKWVLSPQGAEFLKENQAQFRLPITGQLDIATLEKLTGTNIYPFIKHAYRNPVATSSESPFRWEQVDPPGGYLGGPSKYQEYIKRLRPEFK